MPKKLLFFGILIATIFLVTLVVIKLSPQKSLNSAFQTPKNSVYRVLTPKPIESRAVSKLITAKDGGELKLNGEKGEEIIFFIPPNALDKDTTIKMSPLSEVPIENYTSSREFGVLIEPVNTKFIIPASITFDYKPEKQQDPFAQVNGGSGNVQGVQTEPTPSPTPQIPPNGPYFTGDDGIIHTDPDTGSSGISPTSTSPDGSKVSAPVDKGGTQTPDKIDPDKADGFGKQAAGNFASSCSPQNTQMLFDALKYSRAAFDASAYGFAMAGIKQCLDEKLKELEYKCNNDKTSLRRNTFQVYKMVAAAFRLEDIRLKFQILEDKCSAEYTLKGENSIARNSGIIKFTVEASSGCGYIDDASWKASEVSDITVPGTPAHMVYESTSTFALPPAGGTFYTKGSGTLYANSIAGVVSFPMPSTYTRGYFDNQKNVIFKNVIDLNTPITIKTESCIQIEPMNNNFYNPNKP